MVGVVVLEEVLLLEERNQEAHLVQQVLNLQGKRRELLLQESAEVEEAEALGALEELEEQEELVERLVVLLHWQILAAEAEAVEEDSKPLRLEQAEMVDLDIYKLLY
jgi:hypothetical protein